MRHPDPPRAPRPPSTSARPRPSPWPVASSPPARPAPAVGEPPAGVAAYQPDVAFSRRALGVPDPTGFYQQTPSGRPVTLQLSNAGKMVVGWWALPPGRYGAAARLTSWVPDTQLASGAFVVDTRRPRSDNGWTVYWWTTGASADEPAWTDPTDFGARADRLAGAAGVGIIEFVGYGQVTLRFHPRSRTADAFARYATYARVASSTASQVEGRGRDLLAVHHLQPMAPRWLERIVRRLSDREAVRMLAEWQATSELVSPSARRVYRRRVLARARIEELEPGSLPESHREFLSSYVQLLLSGVGMVLGGERRSLLDWYTYAGAEETDPAERRPLDLLGIGALGPQCWAYVLDFVPVTKDYSRVVSGVTVMPSGFLLAVRRVAVEMVMEGPVPKLDSDDVPVLAHPERLQAVEQESFTWSGGGVPNLSERIDGEGRALVGAMLDIGAGLEQDLRAAARRASVLKGGQIGGTDATAQVTFFTSMDLSVGEFDGAIYQRASLGGPGGGITAASVETGSSLHTLTLANGMTLSRVETKVLEPGLKWPNGRDVSDLLHRSFGWFTGLLTPKLQIGSVGMAIGYIHLVGTERRRTARTRRTPPSALRVETARRVLFERDSSRLIVSETDLARDARAMLEVVFATYRAVLSQDGARLTLTGLASPEGSTEHNVWLSTARARTVELALRDACPWQTASVLSLGLGEGPARRAGLKDPPLDPPGLAGFIAGNPGVEEQWRRWRRVDVNLSGRVVFVALDEDDPTEPPLFP